jgi:hypothetical protein
MAAVISAAILGFTTLWVLAPLLGWGGGEEEAAGEAASAREELLEARRQILTSIKDLDMEFQIGKLTKEDYEETRERLAREAVDVLKRIDGGGHGR